MRLWLRVVTIFALLPTVSFFTDQAIWTLRGSPIRQVDVSIITAMELKGHKEDYGIADTEPVSCGVMLTPSPSAHGWVQPCWWLEQHRNVTKQF